MTGYQPRSNVICASRWFRNGDHPGDYEGDAEGLEGGVLRIFSGSERRTRGWEGSVVRYYRHPELSGQARCAHCGDLLHDHGWIDQGRGGRVVCPGDWVVTDAFGQHHPCKPDSFEALFVLASV
jgi:hypothetical protein